MPGKPRSVLVLQMVLPPTVLVVGHHSGHLVAEIIRSAPVVGPPLFLSLLLPWLAWLLVLVIRPFNVGVLQLFGARYPLPGERSKLGRLWPQVLARAGVPRGRYTLLVVNADDAYPWLQRDLGLYVVAIGEQAVGVLDDGALTAVLAQRLARQRTYLALLGGLCLWAALPLVAIAFAGALTFRAVHGIGKVFAGAASKVGLKSGRRVSIGLGSYLAGALALYLVGMLGFYLVGVVSMTKLHIVITVVAIVVLVAILAVLLIAWLGRRVELATNLVAIQWGYGPGLRDAMVRMRALDSSRPHKPTIGRMTELFSTHLPASKHLAQLERTELSPQEQPADTSK